MEKITVPTLLKNPLSAQIGVVGLKITNLSLNALAIYSLWLVVKAVGDQPGFKIKLLAASLVSNWWYRIYVNWVRENYEELVFKKLQKLNQEDSILGFIELPLVLLFDFISTSISWVFIPIKWMFSFCIPALALFFKNNLAYLTFEILVEQTASRDDIFCGDQSNILNAGAIDVDYILLDNMDLQQENSH